MREGVEPPNPCCLFQEGVLSVGPATFSILPGSLYDRDAYLSVLTDSDKRFRRSRRQLSEERREAILYSEWDTITDVELTADHIAFFREAGASEILLTLITTDPEDAGVNRNSVRQEAKRYVFYGDLDGDPEEFIYNGGVFFAKMWDGDLYGAYRHADMNNAVLLDSVFGEGRINSARPDSDSPRVSELDPDRFFICSLPAKRSY